MSTYRNPNKMSSMEKGLYYVVAALTLWALLDVCNRFAVTTLHANSLVYSCLNLIFGGLVLCLIAGRGVEGLATLKSPYSWAMGFLRVLMTIFLISSFLFISATEESFLLRIGMIFAIIAAYLFFKRKPHPTDWPGIILVTGGFTTLALWQDDKFLNYGVILVILAAICNTALTIIAELHPVAKGAKGFRSNCRYTGFLLIICAVVFLLFTLTVSWLASFIKNPEEYGFLIHSMLKIAPTLEDFTDPVTWKAAFVVGIVLRAPTMYLYLYAVKLMKAENVLIASILGTFATLAFESAFGFLHLLDVSSISGYDVLVGSIMAAGALSMIIMRTVREHKSLEDKARNQHPVIGRDNPFYNYKNLKENK